MIDLEKLKTFLLAEECFLREETAEYFGDYSVRDSEFMPLVLDACERYGYKSNGLLLWHCQYQPLDAQSFRMLLEVFKKRNDANTILQLNTVFGRAPAQVLREFWEGELLPSGKVTPALQRVYESKSEFAQWSTRRLLWRLNDHTMSVDRVEGAVDRSIDSTCENVLIEELGRRTDVDFDLVLNRLFDAREDDQCTRGLYTDLVGALGLSRAVPKLVEFLGAEDQYYLQEASTRALIRIGDPKAAHLIHERFGDRSEDFQLSGAEVLGGLKHSDCERIILELLDNRPDGSDASDSLQQALCDQLSAYAIERVETTSEPYDVELRGKLILAARMHDLILPEEEEWVREITRAEELRNRAAFLADRDLVLEEKEEEELHDWDDETLDESEFLDEDIFAPQPDSYSGYFSPNEEILDARIAEPHGPVFREGPKTGRNDPCPCGSGKKYKKCCAKKGE